MCTAALCFGFAADFVISFSLDLYTAAPLAGVISLLLAISTPIQGTIGVLSDVFTTKRFSNRIKEVKVGPFMQKVGRCLPSRFGLGHESMVIQFGVIGTRLQNVSFHMALVQLFFSVTIVGMCYLTSSMYALSVKANWHELTELHDTFTREQAMARVQATIMGLGSSALGLAVILWSGLTTTAFKLGGMPWLLTHLVIDC
jgi:hypothetical protein